MSLPTAPLPPPPPPPAVPGETGGETASTPVRAEPPRRVTDLACPNCGGPLEVAAGLRTVTCPYCETPLLALGEVGIRRFAVEPEIEAARARQVTEGWWRRGWNKHRKLRHEAETAEAFLCFLPFFRIQADAVGYAFGTEKRQRTVGSGKNRRTETYEVDVERRTEKHFDRTFSAVNVAEWGVQKIDLEGDRVVPFDADLLERRGMVFPPTGSEAAVRAEALAAVLADAEPSRGLYKVRFRFLETVRERFSVVYYPLWLVRYRFRGRSYQVVVDGEDGELAYGKAPGNDLYRALMLVASEAAACFVATTALQAVFAGWAGDEPLGLLAIAGAIALAIFIWGWRHFRWGGVVEEGTGIVEVKGLRGQLLSRLKRST